MLKTLRCWIQEPAGDGQVLIVDTRKPISGDTPALLIPLTPEAVGELRARLHALLAERANAPDAFRLAGAALEAIGITPEPAHAAGV